MDLQLLISQFNSIALTLISPTLYGLTDDRDTAYFHTEIHSNWFFVQLNEFLNTRFNSPLDNDQRVSVFQLTIDVLSEYSDNVYFEEFLNQAGQVKKFFFETRYYRYYISPFEISLSLSLADLINYHANYSKHSLYHLNIIKKNLLEIFKQNNIPNHEQEDYNDHLVYFKEAVLDDRLNYNQTRMIEVLGNFFLSYWWLINSPERDRIDLAIRRFTEEHGRSAKWDLKMPENMNKTERFFWDIKGLSFCKRDRLEENIPETNKYLIEKETSFDDVIDKSVC